MRYNAHLKNNGTELNLNANDFLVMTEQELKDLESLRLGNIAQGNR